jgi:hypothetical protein
MSFHNNFQDTEGTKMADPILESPLKTGLNTTFSTFLLPNKKSLKISAALENSCKFVPL